MEELIPGLIHQGDLPCFRFKINSPRVWASGFGDEWAFEGGNG
jgi:hypothetical protein